MLKRQAADALDGSPTLIKRRCLGPFPSPFGSPGYTGLLSNLNTSPFPGGGTYDHKRPRTESASSPSQVQHVEIEYLKRKHAAELYQVKTEAVQKIEEYERTGERLKQQMVEQAKVIERLEQENKILKSGFSTMSKKLVGERELQNTVGQQQEKIRQLEHLIYALRMHLAKATGPGVPGSEHWGGGNDHVF